MKKLAMIAALSVVFMQIASNSYAKDRLFLHNNDRITLTSGEDIVDFSYYSISGRSRIDVKCAGAGSGTKIFKNSEGWLEGTCHGGMATITIRETGGPNPSKDSQGDIPSDSDVVIRFSDNYTEDPYKPDDDQKGNKCKICGKKLDW